MAPTLRKEIYSRRIGTDSAAAIVALPRAVDRTRFVTNNDVPPPPVIGHRGAAATAPENTLAGLRAARAAGAAWVEIDLRLSADNRAVMFHDAVLDRTTDGRGRLADWTLARLARLDAGSWFDPAFAGQRVADLPTVLRLLDDLGLGANMELKPEHDRRDRLVDAVSAALTETRPSVPLLLSSFDRPTLAVCRERLPDVPRGLLADDLPDDWRRIGRELDCRSWHLGYGSLGESPVAALREAGFRIVAWTVNDPKWARRLWRWGVDSVITDDPALVLAEWRRAR